MNPAWNGVAGVPASSLRLPAPDRFIGAPGELVNPPNIGTSEIRGRFDDWVGGERVVPGIDLHNRTNWAPQIHAIATKNISGTPFVEKGTLTWFVGSLPATVSPKITDRHGAVKPNTLAIFGSKVTTEFKDLPTFALPTAVESFWKSDIPQMLSYAAFNHMVVVVPRTKHKCSAPLIQDGDSLPAGTPIFAALSVKGPTPLVRKSNEYASVFSTSQYFAPHTGYVYSSPMYVGDLALHYNPGDHHMTVNLISTPL
jgi:hypothetical protein